MTNSRSSFCRGQFTVSFLLKENVSDTNIIYDKFFPALRDENVIADLLDKEGAAVYNAILLHVDYEEPGYQELTINTMQDICDFDYPDDDDLSKTYGVVGFEIGRKLSAEDCEALAKLVFVPLIESLFEGATAVSFEWSETVETTTWTNTHL